MSDEVEEMSDCGSCGRSGGGPGYGYLPWVDGVRWREGEGVVVGLVGWPLERVVVI